MGSGKTAQTVNFLSKVNNFIWIAPNQALTSNTLPRINEVLKDTSKCMLYKDDLKTLEKKNEMRKVDKIIICLNSLHYLSKRKYENVIIDEIDDSKNETILLSNNKLNTTNNNITSTNISDNRNKKDFININNVNNSNNIINKNIKIKENDKKLTSSKQTKYFTMENYQNKENNKNSSKEKNNNIKNYIKTDNDNSKAHDLLSYLKNIKINNYTIDNIIKNNSIENLREIKNNESIINCNNIVDKTNKKSLRSLSTSKTEINKSLIGNHTFFILF